VGRGVKRQVPVVDVHEGKLHPGWPGVGLERPHTLRHTCNKLKGTRIMSRTLLRKKSHKLEGGACALRLRRVRLVTSVGRSEAGNSSGKTKEVKRDHLQPRVHCSRSDVASKLFARQHRLHGTVQPCDTFETVPGDARSHACTSVHASAVLAIPCCRHHCHMLNQGLSCLRCRSERTRTVSTDSTATGGYATAFPCW
jgi:hypothetical protein